MGVYAGCVDFVWIWRVAMAVSRVFIECSLSVGDGEKGRFTLLGVFIGWEFRIDNKFFTPRA